MANASKQVRFSTTNTVYSLLSPPRAVFAVPDDKQSTRRRPKAHSFPTAARPHVANGTPLPTMLKPPLSDSDESSASSSSSRSRRNMVPHTVPQASSSIPSALPLRNREVAQKDMRLHFLIAFAPNKNPPINYDLSYPPSVIIEHMSSKSFLEPATDPLVSSLIITSPLLQSKIEVVPTYRSRSYVTVMDVLVCLHYAFQTSVSRAEYDSVSNPKTSKLIDKAYFARCNGIRDPETRNAEARMGVKRIDFLTGRTRFLGVSGTKKNSNVWELNVSTWPANWGHA